MPTPPVPPIQPGQGGLSQQYQQAMLGYGTLQTGVGAPGVPAGGAAAMYQTATSQDVTVVRDDALVQLIGGLREDFARFIDMQKQFNSEKSSEMLRLQEQLRETRQQQQGQAVSQATGSGGGGVSPLAGQTTSTGHETGYPRLTQSAVAAQIVGPNGNVITPQMMQPIRGMVGPSVPWLPYGGMPFPYANQAYAGAGAGQSSGPPPNSGVTILAPGGRGAPSPGGSGGGTGGGGSGGGGGGGGGSSPMFTGGPSNRRPGGGGWRRMMGGIQSGGMIRRTGTAIGALGGPMTMIGGMVSGVGIGMQLYSAGKGLYDEGMSQREKNRQFQEVEGGSNADAFKDRFSKFYGRLTHPGLDSASYDEAFMGATTIGYRGASRDQYIGSAEAAHNNLGMSMEDWNKVASQNAREANSSFRELYSSLSQVSRAARQFGVNARMLRDVMSSSTNAAWQAGLGSGATAAGTAQAVAQASWGRVFAGETNTGYLQPVQQAMAAGMMGLTPNALLNQESNNPLSGLGAQDTLMKQFMQVPPQAAAYIKQLVEQAGGSQAIMNDPNAVMIIANQLKANADKMGLPGDLQMYCTQVWNKYTGRSDTVDMMLQAWIRQVAGAGLQASAKNAGQSAPGFYNALTQNKNGSTTIDMRHQMGSHAAHEVQSYGDYLQHGQSRGYGSSYQEFRRFQGNNNADGNQAMNAYLYYDVGKGKANPALAALANNVQASNENVQVSTKKGPQVMPLSMAMEYYPAEVAAGNVKFMDGPDKGKSTQQVAGMADSSSPTAQQATKEMANNVPTGSKSVHTLDWWKQHHADDFKQQDNGNTTVTLQLSEGAKRLVKLVGPGNNPGDSTGDPLVLNPNGASFNPS